MYVSNTSGRMILIHYSKMRTTKTIDSLSGPIAFVCPRERTRLLVSQRGQGKKRNPPNQKQPISLSVAHGPLSASGSRAQALKMGQKKSW